MAALRTAAVLEEAFAILARDQPAAFYRMTRQLDGLTVSLAVADEAFTVACAADRPAIRDDVRASPASAEVRTERQTILDLCDGRLRLLEAVMRRRLFVRASEPLLLRLSRAVTAFSEGAVRARRMRALLERLRADRPPS
jgi:molybdopterin-guanine dinucleotide biosynthesis protein A